jgi:hypothetical protein
MKLNRITCTIALLALLPAAGRAVPIDFAYQFTAGGLGGPDQTVTGNFGGWFDPIIDNGSITWIDISFAGVTFSTANAAGSIHTGVFNGTTNFIAYQLGGIVFPGDGVQLIQTSVHDFFLVLFDPTLLASSNFFQYSAGTGSAYDSRNVSLTRIPSVSDAGSSAMLAMGAFGLTALARARRRWGH